MYAIPPKKMMIINILDILRRYTDEDHRLAQKEIIEILKSEYSMKADRKAVKRNLMNLVEFGYDIEYSESIRTNKSGEEEVLYTDWYLNRDFSDTELRLLIDSLLFNKHIPHTQCKELIEKLKGLSNIYFSAKVRHICNLPESIPANRQLFYTIEVLDEAIARGLKVEFSYNAYGTDKKLHPRTDADGIPKRYLINPYQMVANNGRYYLICNYDKYDRISNYRIDRITDIRLMTTPTKPARQVTGLANGLNLPKHMAEHIYMFAGESSRCVFRADKGIVDQIIDWFGMDVAFSNETDNSVQVTVIANESAMFYWLLQYGQHVEVMEPEQLRDRIISAIDGMKEKYQKVDK